MKIKMSGLKANICFFASILAVHVHLSCAKPKPLPFGLQPSQRSSCSSSSSTSISSCIHRRCDDCELRNISLSKPNLDLDTLLVRGGGQGRDYDYGYGYGSGGGGGDDRYYEGDDEPDNDYSRGGYGYGSQGSGSGSGSGSGVGRYNDYEDDRYRNDRGRHEGDYYGDERDRDRAPSKSESSLKSSLKSANLPDVGGLLRHGNKKIGMMLLGGGAVFTLLGISLFFNKTLMRLGNLLFIAGVPLFIGPGRTAGYFLQPKKARATGCLGCGIFLVMVGWPVLGIALEIFGILNLFGNMFPVFMILLKQMPVIGPMLQGDNGGGRGRSKSGSRKKDYYEDSYRYEDEDDKYGNDDGYRQDDRRYY